VGAAVAVTAGGLLLAACGTGEAPSRASATDPSTTAEPTAEPPTPDGPAFGPATEVQLSKPSGEWDLQLADVRLGEHDGFDRLVLDFAGSGAPGWGVEYADRAVAEGSGEIVPLAGDRVLTISASGTAMPEPGSYETPRRLGPSGGLAEVRVGGWFEGYVQVFVGLDGDARPFRVFALADPPRLVVDVSHPPS